MQEHRDQSTVQEHQTEPGKVTEPHRKGYLAQIGSRTLCRDWAALHWVSILASGYRTLDTRCPLPPVTASRRSRQSTHELRDHVEQDIALRIVELLCLILCACILIAYQPCCCCCCCCCRQSPLTCALTSGPSGALSPFAPAAGLPLPPLRKPLMPSECSGMSCPAGAPVCPSKAYATSGWQSGRKGRRHSSGRHSGGHSSALSPGFGHCQLAEKSHNARRREGYDMYTMKTMICLNGMEEWTASCGRTSPEVASASPLCKWQPDTGRNRRGEAAGRARQV